MSDPANDRYVMGHNDPERRRLALQASILQPFTEQLFRRAGITAGMHVLDIGCGVGDVSLLAARMVGRNGSVTSVDIDPIALQRLRERAESEGIYTIQTSEADISSFTPVRKFDAVVGRHILIHTQDPLRVLNDCRALLQRRGVAAFQEYDFQLVTPGYPATPLRDHVFTVMNAFFAQAAHANIGSRLYHLFLQAGFAQPECRGEFPVDGGPDSPHNDWFADAVRSILPRARAMGVAGAADIDVETLKQRLRDEARSGGGLAGPLMFSCFARRPD